jgi:hypothetical protein
MAEMPIGTHRFPRLPCPSSKLTSYSAVLDGGTGFLKVGYAAQVCRTTTTLPFCSSLIHIPSSELPRAPVSLDSGAAHLANGGAGRRHRGQGYHVR